MCSVPIDVLAASQEAKGLASEDRRQLLLGMASTINNSTAWRQYNAARPVDTSVAQWYNGSSVTTLKDMLSVSAENPAVAASLLVTRAPELVKDALTSENLPIDLLSSPEVTKTVISQCVPQYGIHKTIDILVAQAIRAGKVPSIDVFNTTIDPAYFITALVESPLRAELFKELQLHPSYLVKRGLVGIYMTLLEEGRISPLHPSFAAFIEECGSQRLPLPQDIIFSLALTDPKNFNVGHLQALAPSSSFLQSAIQRGMVQTVVDNNHVHVAISMRNPHDCDVGNGCARRDSLTILHEDESIIVIDKAHGIPVELHRLCHSNIAHQSCKGDIITSLLRHVPEIRRVRNCGIVQRLDTDTSGVMVVAKTDEALSFLTPDKFLNKTYFALCRDFRRSAQPEEGQIEERLKNNSNTLIRSMTRYSIVRHYQHSIVAVQASITHGKKHQIRRHLASIGLPICGDGKYGASLATSAAAGRTALHASSVTFRHPKSNKSMTINAPIPRDFCIMAVGSKVN